MIFAARRFARKYALVAFLLFGLQAIVSNGGAMELIYPDLSLPISFAAGRAFHINISIYWPLLGMTGAIYYVFCREAVCEIYSSKLLNWNFWLFLLASGSILGSLLLGISEGREYLEGKWPLRGLLIVSLVLLAYNLSRTYLTVKVPKNRATIVAILSGVWTLILLYIPTLIIYDHPTVDELAKFLVVHLWEEMSLELIGIGVLAAFLMEIIDVNRRTIEKAIYLDICLTAVGGILATSHHYYWVGAPGYWSIIGLIFSVIQAVPTVILFYTTIKSIRTKMLDNYSFKERITILLIVCSMIYHVVGAGLLGLFMAYPRINKYVHGTYMTSAHSHLAVFGVFGFLVLALCFYILLQGETLSKKRYRSCLLAIIALNIGLVIMGGALLAAGGLQAYSWRVFNLTPAETNLLIKPYLVIRAVGGWLFAFGSILFTYVVICLVKSHIKEILFSNYAASSFDFKEMKALKCNLTEWIRKQKEVEENLLQVREIIRNQTHS